MTHDAKTSAALEASIEHWAENMKVERVEDMHDLLVSCRGDEGT